MKQSRMFNLEKREEKRQAACDKLFKEIIADPKFQLLSELNPDTGNSRRTNSRNLLTFL